MKRQILFRLLFAPFLVLLLIAGLVVLPVVREFRLQEKNQALIAAIKRDDALSVVHLLDEGADANAKDLPRDIRPFWRVFWDKLHHRPMKTKDTDRTALQIAIYECTNLHEGNKSPDIHLVQALLEHRADPNVSSAHMYPLLIFALNNRRTDIALLLIRHGEKVDAVWNGEPWPLLVDAAESGSPRVLQVMLDKGTNINVQDTVYGATALMMAAEMKDAASVEFLLAHHANVTIKDFDGHTALYYAQQLPVSAHDWQITKLLRQAGAK